MLTNQVLDPASMRARRETYFAFVRRHGAELGPELRLRSEEHFA